MIAFVELASIAVLLLHWALSPHRIQRGLESLAIAAGAFVGEEICLRLEGAYQYASGWHLFLDRMPVAVLLIWPSVVLSARAVASLLTADPLERGLWAFAVVWLDASLVEPVATHAGLWSWNLPGPFHVAWVGPFGWGAYALFAVWFIERETPLLVPVAAPLLAQAVILAAHWGLGRWLGQPEGVVELLAALAPGIIATAVASRVRSRVRLPLKEALARAAAAGLFVVLLALRPDAELAVVFACVAVPYLLLLPPLQSVASASASDCRTVTGFW